ncbi:MAG TPA: DUF5063 domain-containing protein [Sporichthya sp.]|nr:DUF5063 domain-containing protein [Sporichthya sp.]
MTEDPANFATQIADQIESFLIAVRECARADSPEEAVPMLHLATTGLLLAGGRLGTISDIVLEEQFEPDAGEDPDLDELRTALADLLEPIDEYAEVFDPYEPRPELMICRMSDDLTEVAASLLHGLQHYKAGREAEALWWWQYSYLNTWGLAASTTLRALHSVLAHDRLDTHTGDTALLQALDPAVTRL